MFNDLSLDDFEFDPRKDFLDGGCSGSIYKVLFKKDKKYYALKKIEEKINDEKQYKSIRREYHIMINSFHPNIERCYGGFRQLFPFNNKICYFFVLELIKGQNLTKLINEYISKSILIKQELIIKIFKEITNGLAYLHKMGILHRDLSTDNIMLDKEHNIFKITDFGISAYYQDNKKGLGKTLIFGKSCVGRQDYVSPEIYKAYIQKIDPIYDFKTDIYSLGVVMFNLMTFKFPSTLQKRNLNLFFSNQIDSNKYDKNLINLVYSMLNEDPKQRPSSLEILNSLEFIENKLNHNNHNIININKVICDKYSCFSCVMYCLSHIDQIYHYFKAKRENPKLKENLFSVIKEFGNILEKSKELICLNNNFIKNFIDKISAKIMVFNDIENFEPKIIIESFFNYFLFNLPKLADYNNSRAIELFKNRKNIEENFFINQKIEIYKEQYKNVFASNFYFLVLKKYICPHCNHIIKQDLDIEFCLEFSDKGNIKDLLSNFFQKKEISNTGKIIYSCNNCGIMPKHLFECKSFYSKPKTFIFHFNNFVNVDEFLEIKENQNNNEEKSGLYFLKAIIFKNKINDSNEFKYEVAINYMDQWVFLTDKSLEILNFDYIINKGKICTVLYRFTENELSPKKEISEE